MSDQPVLLSRRSIVRVIAERCVLTRNSLLSGASVPALVLISNAAWRLVQSLDFSLFLVPPTHHALNPRDHPRDRLVWVAQRDTMRFWDIAEIQPP